MRKFRGLAEIFKEPQKEDAGQQVREDVVYH